MRAAAWPPEERELSDARNCQILEPCAGKLARTVLRGGGGGNAAPLPDHLAQTKREEREDVDAIETHTPDQAQGRGVTAAHRTFNPAGVGSSPSGPIRWRVAQR
jgi:hypothetical protein